MKTKTKKSVLSISKNGKHIRRTLRNTVVLAILLGVVNVASAQNKLGVKVMAGGSCQSEILKISDNNNLQFAYGLGITDNFRFSETFALQTGLEYTRKGMHNDESNTDLENTLHYLQLPVLAEFSAGEKAGFKNGKRVYFAAGPYFAYLLDAESKENNVKIADKEDFRNYDLGMRFNLGMEFPVSEINKLRVGLNYDMGFTDIYKNQTDMQNKMCSVSLGYIF